MTETPGLMRDASPGAALISACSLEADVPCLIPCPETSWIAFLREPFIATESILSTPGKRSIAKVSKRPSRQ
jgi:hypothetical protein